MKNSKELKIGIFVVAVLVTSFFVINYLRGKDIFNKEMELVVPNASGNQSAFQTIEKDSVPPQQIKNGVARGRHHFLCYDKIT